ncbi:hypothetical protein JCM10213_007271 [Rhodosporidiobolus nylandii]
MFLHFVALLFCVATAAVLPGPLSSRPTSPSSPFLPLLAANITGTPRFNRIVVFGDSWSDDGTGAYGLTNGAWPSDSHYADHRFTDGPTWAEQLASGLNVSHQSFAIAGATTNNTLVQGYTGANLATPVSSVQEQIESWKKNVLVESEKALLLVQGGFNDWLFGQAEEGGVSAKESADSLGNAMLQLVGAGAQYILLANLPSTSPYHPYTTLNPYPAASLANFTRDFRDALYSFDVQRQQVGIVDWFALWEMMMESPGLFGLGERTLGQPCLSGVYGDCPNVTVCTTPTTYIWWDEFNPTTYVQSYMASAAFNVLKQQGSTIAPEDPRKRAKREKDEQRSRDDEGTATASRAGSSVRGGADRNSGSRAGSRPTPYSYDPHDRSKWICGVCQESRPREAFSDAQQRKARKERRLPLCDRCTTKPQTEKRCRGPCGQVRPAHAFSDTMRRSDSPKCRTCQAQAVAPEDEMRRAVLCFLRIFETFADAPSHLAPQDLALDPFAAYRADDSASEDEDGGPFDFDDRRTSSSHTLKAGSERRQEEKWSAAKAYRLDVAAHVGAQTQQQGNEEGKEKQGKEGEDGAKPARPAVVYDDDSDSQYSSD